MKLIFNTSMPRSGSELLQVILHQNPRIYGSTTSPLLEYQFAARSQFNLAEVKSQPHSLMVSAFDSVCSGIAEGYYKPITNRPVVIDKSRGWMHYWEWVNRWNPNPKMICVVRDLRDIVCSMERIFRANKHMPDSIDIPVEMKNITIDQRINHWLNTQPIGLALQRLHDANSRGVSEKILFVKYENLCSQPKKEMQRVYEYIEEDYFEHDFGNLQKEVAEDDSHFGIYGSHAVQSKLGPTGKNWKDILTPSSSNGIRNFASWYFEQFSY